MRRAALLQHFEEVIQEYSEKAKPKQRTLNVVGETPPHSTDKPQKTKTEKGLL